MKKVTAWRLSDAITIKYTYIPDLKRRIDDLVTKAEEARAMLARLEGTVEAFERESGIELSRGREGEEPLLLQDHDHGAIKMMISRGK